MNSRELFSEGSSLGFDYKLPNSYGAVGLTMGASYNFSGILVFEPAVLIRWYYNFRGQTDSGFFSQADVGASIIIEEKQINYLFLYGFRTGYRFVLNKWFFLEPYGRIAYPSAFGIGINAGVRF